MAKLIKANVIRESHYPDWLANIVVAPQKGGKWRVCVYFTDLNKAYPKDSFSLPKIDLIIDATSKHELLSFMDAFPGATYQRLVNKMFKEMIGKTMEVYIEDMLVKNIRASDYIAHVEEKFGVLRKYRMMLNPSKNIHEVQLLTGQVAALNRFVSKSANKCLPFFKILISLTNNSECSTYPRRNKIQKPVYYVSKVIIGAETRPKHWIISYLNLRTVVAPKLEITLPKVETLEEQNPDEDLARWKLFVDGSSNQHGCGAGLVLQTPSGEHMEYTIHIGFKVTNNEVEYEALLRQT
ncbi:hypothetical protein Acr_18g0009290 [Actinidia rufa]|uniref:Uncharacterized protein n=1 Tax=Actinidia rufa TaxID=165716 RepID=A0A7J0G7K7_9ERIC|nr:hypothetical protein Acr_18g0009290 [Actinidia rufa]